MKAFNEQGTVKANFTTATKGYHGDVVVYKEELPKEFGTFKKLDDGILALGEHTGHCHKLFGDYDLRECPKTKTKFLRIVDDTFLKHQEHRPVILPPGTYRIGIQREFDHYEGIIREVLD